MRRALCIAMLCAASAFAVAQQRVTLPARAVVHLWARADPDARNGFVSSTRGDTVIVQIVSDQYMYHPLYVTDTLHVHDIDSLDLKADDEWQRLYPSNTARSLYTTPDAPLLRSGYAIVRVWSSANALVDQRATLVSQNAAGDTLVMDVQGARRAIALAGIDTLRVRLTHGYGPVGGAVRGLIFGELFAWFGSAAANAPCNFHCGFSMKSVHRYYATFGVIGTVLGALNGRRHETWLDVHPRP